MSVFSSAVVILCCLQLTGAAVQHDAGKHEVTPINKVIQMLTAMNGKGKKAKHEEEVEFAKFHEWCDNVKFERTKSIKEGTDLIEQLAADIAKSEADAETLSAEIADLQAAIAKAEGELKAAKAVRKAENADYEAVHTDLSESIDACARAVQVLKARGADVAQSLAQVSSNPRIPASSKAVLESFLSLRVDAGAQVGAPEANAYEFQSGGVVAMLEKLKLKFEDERLAAEKAEMNAKHNFNMLAQGLTDNIKADTDEEAEKTAAKARALNAAATAKGDKATAEATKEEDEAVLSDTTAECEVKAQEFEKNQATRAAEIGAITKAIEIMSSDDVSGNADKHLPTLVQMPRKKTSLAQLRSSNHGNSDIRQRAFEFVQGRARLLKSKYLSLVASRIAEDPFAKVKKMIKDLIVKLMEESNAEADAKAYCDTELATNKQTRENKASEVEELTATSEQLTAKSAELAAQITDLSDSISAVTASQQEATKIRMEEKATNAQTVADAKEAQTAVTLATKVLKEFYSKSGSAAMLQGAQGETMRQEMAQASKEPYKGMDSAAGGIFGMLEVILSDFARLEAETSTEENSAQTAYERMMADTTQDIAVKKTEMEHSQNSKQLTDEKNANTKKELGLTQGELDAAMDYYDKLKEQCVNTGVSYEERVKAREEEIQSLQEAMKILNQEEIA